MSKYSSNESMVKSLLQIPSSMIIKASDADVGSGYYNVRRKLQKAKKSSQGQTIQDPENNLSNLDLRTSTRVEQALEIHQQYVSNRLAPRNFYNSKKRAQLKRAYEVQNNRFRRRLCAKERTCLIGKKGKKHSSIRLMNTKYYINYLVKGKSRLCPVMFTGDRNTRVGSKTKGFRRYGGKWKQELHGMNVNVCITNENISQTCIYCFSKLDNPIHRKMIKDKEIKTQIKESFLCQNSGDVLVSNKKAVKPRDDLSPLVRPFWSMLATLSVDIS
ncbi:uncharacterized protein RHIMIDRAFT_257389 [Rhizopus microsporus ATCC 52813]|uniref:Uncharacterized protein n=1 Tax=Rhizopus microsporus ATCC 52813 TaxID=1340429 RepID=A0A2G4SRL0_RHIZD|nr:uncharacterized protein RHIMIDRAFT_257389 [Rhizopus microsporus ATCC 52813]PHZ11382.1 hypothetical protein RHIMIDRAFT_257389 [Rhizopus microsporus ATCC 52813]